MKIYTFEELSDIEFEAFINDLLTKKYGWTIERFKPGTDGGIDGRLYTGPDQIIIQSKHYRMSGIKSLLSKIKSDESIKAKKLSPKRYIFATSLSLNPSDKNKIQSLFSGVNLATGDILGNDDINAILRENSDVLKNWYKLWAENSSTLELFIHPEIKSKEIILNQRLNKINKLFVETEDIQPALDALKDKHAVVISGEPGVGKTTLAEYLCQWYMKQGYSVDVIDGDISSHPMNLQDKNQKIIYYFDDFLGSNYFEAISGNSDSSVVRLIEHIKNEPNKRLILTSRSNIIQKAELLSQPYRNFGLSENRYVINISNYSKLTKGKILYSHLWHSIMDTTKKYEILKDKFYMKIITHRNFNPRLISFALNEACKIQDDICKSIFNNLENPAQIWDHCYTGQLDEQARILVKLCVANNGLISDALLKSAYEKALRAYHFHPTTNLPRDYDCAIKLVCDSILTKNISEDNTTYTHFNPSVSDYIINKISNIDDAKNLIECIGTSSCVSFYANLIIVKSKMRGSEGRQLSEYLLERFGFEFNKSFCYTLHLALYLGNDTDKLKEALAFFDETLSNIDLSLSKKGVMLATLISESLRYNISDAAVINALNTCDFDDSDIKAIYDAIYEEDPHSNLIEFAKNALINYIKSIADDYVTNDSDFSKCKNQDDLDSVISSTLDYISDEYPMLSADDIEEIKYSFNYTHLMTQINDYNYDYYDEDEYRTSRDDSIISGKFSDEEIIDSMFLSSTEFQIN